MGMALAPLETQPVLVVDADAFVLRKGLTDADTD